jgi:alpha-amylase/alpha-mannosidase (GH57 family)
MGNLSVALFWHFHQPPYARPGDNVLPLPWVRLHALKDYLDMLRHVRKFPELRATFNFTPSLLMQLKGYQEGRITDRQYVLFQKKADDLTVEERVEILKDFFLANWDRMIEPYPRYFSLLLKRGKNIVDEELPTIARDFTVEEMRDLQVWANLVWIDPLYRDEVRELFERGKNFRETDKEAIQHLTARIFQETVAEYRAAQEAGQIELTTSPLYHPILPLLINSDLARESNPNLEIPFQFRHPEDAVRQVEEGIRCFESFFGTRPKGLWPSEGSVCPELAEILPAQGIKWIATDEEILARSIKTSFHRDENGIPNHPEKLYKPWRFGDLKVVFRDHVLSDLIGFTYNAWDPTEAAADLLGRIKHIRDLLPGGDRFLLPIILDGENAWEYYEQDGSEFLDRFYAGLISERLSTTTISQFLAENETKDTLATIFPGSWIGANFNIWIGKTEDHKAWLVVKKIRDRLVEKKIEDPEAWDKLYALEGSDWFWWFGDDYSSLTTEVFDELFRQNAIWIYQRIGDDPPPELFSPLNRRDEAVASPPIERITPVIDGQITTYYEWYNAGYVDIKRIGGTMHRFAGLFAGIYFGFDERNLYIRLDVINHDIQSYKYELKFYKPAARDLDMEAKEGVECRIATIAEAAIPRALVGCVEEGTVEFVVRAHKDGVEVDRTPLLRFSTLLKDAALNNWTV